MRRAVGLHVRLPGVAAMTRAEDQFRQRKAAARAARADMGSSQEAGSPRTGGNRNYAPPLKSDWWKRTTNLVIERDRGLCHLCRSCGCQGTGAESADHDPVPRSECEVRGISPYDPSNLKAAHFKPCPWCGVACQRLKGAGSLEN